jgi:hypothetical protein
MTLVKDFLMENNGHQLLDTNYSCIAYYNRYANSVNDEIKLALVRLMKMQSHEPIQYMLSIKALLDK